MGRWDDATLAEMRQLGDAEGDRAIRSVFDAQGVERVNALLRDLVRNDEMPDLGAFPVVQQFLLDTGELPDWADHDLITAGEQLFLEWGLAAISVLACASLPECYVLRDVARVLSLTGQLEKDIDRRMPETVMMVMSVMQKDGLARRGQGIRVVQKVRLMHAAIRHLVLQPSPAPDEAAPSAPGAVYHAFPWNPADGMPISQKNLSIVILTFSHVVLRGWADLGIAIPRDKQKAFLHCWNVVGHVLGIERRFMAKDVDDARDLFESIKRHDGADTEQGRQLTRSLLRYCERFTPDPNLRPISRILMNVLLTSDTCVKLGVPQLNMMERFGRYLLLRFVLFYNRFKTRWLKELPGSREIAAFLANAVIGDLVGRNRGGNRTAFKIPDSLAEGWGMRRGGEGHQT